MPPGSDAAPSCPPVRVSQISSFVCDPVTTFAASRSLAILSACEDPIG